MYEENDYITQQIKAIVKGLGRFMGLEQIKSFIQLSESQHNMITDHELECLIAISKIELIISTSGMDTINIAKELEMSEERLNKVLNNETIATEEELDRLNNFIINNQEYL